MRNELMEQIIRDKNLFKINLAGMKIRDDEIQEVIEKIKEVKPTVSIIDLDDNELGDQGAIILSKLLGDFKNLKELSLQFNNIGRDGAIDIFSLKKVFSDLDILFHGNQITNVREMDEIERLGLGESLKPHY